MAVTISKRLKLLNPWAFIGAQIMKLLGARPNEVAKRRETQSGTTLAFLTGTDRCLGVIRALESSSKLLSL